MKYRRDPENNDYDDLRPFSINARLTTYAAAMAASPDKFRCDDNGGGRAPSPAPGYVLPVTTVSNPPAGYDWTAAESCIYSHDITINNLEYYIYIRLPPMEQIPGWMWIMFKCIKIDADLGPGETCICTDSAELAPIHCNSPGIPVTYAWYKDGN